MGQTIKQRQLKVLEACDKARRTRQYPRRTLTPVDGEYILWHVLQHLQEDLRTPVDYEGQINAIGAVRVLLQDWRD